MTAVVVTKCRETNAIAAKVVTSTDRATLQSFVDDMTDAGPVVYTDDAKAHQSIPNPHETVEHSVSEYMNGMAHERN